MKTYQPGLSTADLEKAFQAFGAKLGEEVVRNTRKVVPRLDEWAARFPVIRRVRVVPLTLSVAAAAPFSTPEAIESTARMSLWVFTLDDVFDEEQLSERELFLRADSYKAIAQNSAGLNAPPALKAPDVLADALKEVRRDLEAYPLFSDLREQWEQALVGTIDGMLEEQRWRQEFRLRGPAALPSFDAYIRCGRYSIGGPPHIWSGLVTIGDASTPAHLERLSLMEEAASTCIRLANDLRSREKEAAEENINAHVILEHGLRSEGVPAAAAVSRTEELIRGEIDRGLERLDALQAADSTKSGQPEAAIADIARIVCRFYARHDYHTYVGEIGAAG